VFPPFLSFFLASEGPEYKALIRGRVWLAFNYPSSPGRPPAQSVSFPPPDGPRFALLMPSIHIFSPKRGEGSAPAFCLTRMFHNPVNFGGGGVLFSLAGLVKLPSSQSARRFDSLPGCTLSATIRGAVSLHERQCAAVLFPSSLYPPQRELLKEIPRAGSVTSFVLLVRPFHR